MKSDWSTDQMWVRCRHPVSCTSTDSWEPFGTAHSLGTRIHLHGTSTTSRGLNSNQEFQNSTSELLILLVESCASTHSAPESTSAEEIHLKLLQLWILNPEILFLNCFARKLSSVIYVTGSLSTNSRKLKLMPGLNHLQSSQQAQAALV